MLCPKCGYISFDHLTSCQKCDNDLTVISAELKGTLAKVEQYSFLNGVLREPISSDEPPVVDDEGALDSRVEDEDVVGSGEGVEEIEEDSDLDVDGELEIDTIEAIEEPDEPELTVDLDEMAPLDLDGIESVDTELAIDDIEEAENVDDGEADLVLEVGGEGDIPELDGDIELSEDLGVTFEPEITDDATVETAEDDISEIELPAGKGDAEVIGDVDEVVAGESLEIDPDTLSLDLDDIVGPGGETTESKTEPDTAGNGAELKADEELTIDLDQIDLSDLVDGSEGGDGPDPVSNEVVADSPQDEIVLTLEDDVSGGDDNVTDLSALDDSSTDEVMLELDDVSDLGVGGGEDDAILDLSLETDNGDDSVIDSLADIIDLSLEDDKK